MNRQLLDVLCDPDTKEPLRLRDEVTDANGRIVEGYLETPSGRRYPIRGGVPRFVAPSALTASVDSFGNEWNRFNFVDFKLNWQQHTVRNTFGSTDAFRGKVIVDAGGGSGSQTLWMLETGAKHVIMLELSHSVDDVVQRNLSASGYTNYDVIQCSIDSPPLRGGSIDGIVYCHNVIQHTPSVERTARALFALVAPGGEFVFNCYRMIDESDGIVRWFRFHCIYRPLRFVLSHMPFGVILAYSKLMGVLRSIPVLGAVLEKASFCVRGDVPCKQEDSVLKRFTRRYRATVLNTFDAFGSHAFQHHKRDAEIRALIAELQPDGEKIFNVEEYFRRPPPIGCALRLFR